MRLKSCKFVELPKIKDSRGILTFIESENHVPFEIKRIYYLYEVPEGIERGAHAHKSLFQLFVAVSGSFDIVLDDGQSQERIHLDQPDLGLCVGPMIWRTLENFSSAAVCMVIASEHYDEVDYIHDYNDFIHAVRLR